MLSDNAKSEIIHRLFSEYHYYRIETSGRWDKSVKNLCEKVGLVKQDQFEFYIKQPSSDILCEANRIYNETIRFFRFSDYYTEETIIDYMRKHIVLCEETRLAEEDDDLDPIYFWTSDMESQIEAYEKAIEEIKIKLYKNKDADSKRKDEIRADLRKSQRL